METINTTPARNNDNINLAIKKLEGLFESLSKHEAEHPDKVYGYAGIPGVLKTVREKGINKIFFVGRDYHGKYEDDYCYFTYWDEDSKEFFNDEWGTWAAFPSYDLYEMPIKFSDGWESGMIDKNAFLEVLKNREMNILSKITFDKNTAKEYNLRVKVVGGRKWKGEGYLVNTEESSYRFATPMFRNRYYGTNDFGVSTTETALIWNPVDNTINRANFQYIEFMDADKIMEKYIVWAKNIINISSIYNIKNDTFTLDIDYSFTKFMDEVWMPNHNIGNVLSTAYDPEEEERKRKASEFRASKMPGIIEWVENNTDKKGEDVITLALHIFNKRYSS